ncbi:uncharacterized protein LOC111348180 [Spodoptera litura]|uniref:Uncharacterized protein LOC111348180 n=1 Tax=Spodoptera litura TaxID=69820 RepID=A0A9J7DQD6_SPOLT|nr:uncharacterized protein LOC111348180 [Spodoptera litura]
MGDFNFGGVKWPLRDTGYVSPRENNFIQWYNDSNLQQIIDKHTRYRQGNQPSFLDLVLTNDESLIAKIDHLAPIGKSDHTCLLANIQIQTQAQKKETNGRPNFKKANFEKINEMLQTELFGSMRGTICVQNQFEILLKTIREAINFCLRCEVSIFADDTKIFADPTVDYNHLQEDLNRIANWSKEWLINLNASKCTVLHIGTSNPRLTYKLCNAELTGVKVQTDLGVKITEDLKWEEHITSITKKAKSLVYLIRKAFGVLTPEMMLKIHKTFVRPILEYAFQVWSPYFVKDIEHLEKVQRSFTKIPRALKQHPYEERLKVLNLTTLKDRRQRGDLIETYKILSGHYDNTDFEQLFSRNENVHLRGHHLKLCKSLSKNIPHRHFLSNRVVGAWNRLPEYVIAAQNVNQFKNRLDRYTTSN